MGVVVDAEDLGLGEGWDDGGEWAAGGSADIEEVLEGGVFLIPVCDLLIGGSGWWEGYLVKNWV